MTKIFLFYLVGQLIKKRTKQKREKRWREDNGDDITPVNASHTLC